MLRAIVTVFLADLFVPRTVAGQTPPQGSPPEPIAVDALPAGGEPADKPQSSSPSIEVSNIPDAEIAAPASGPHVIRGRALEIEGGVLVGATVWAARYAEPGRRLAEAVTDSRGNFTLTVPASEQTSGLVLKAVTLSGLEATELLEFAPPAEDRPLRLWLRKPGENYEEPSFDAVDAWLAERMKLLAISSPTSGSGAEGLAAIFIKRRRKAAAWDRAVETLAVLRRTGTPEARLLAAPALMRIGAWQSAGEILAQVNDPRVEHEKVVLEGVRLNFLRSPQEASRVLERTLLNGSEDEIAHLELGRAAVLDEDWPGALQKLDPVLKKKSLARYAHYLRARSLFALGDIEAAAEEARLLTRRVKKKRLPAQARSFVDDLRGRLEERSIQALQSVMTQPLSDLQKAVPSLEKLDASAASDQQGLQVIVKRVGDNIERFFREFASTSALEVIRQSRLDNKGKSHSLRRAEMYYVFHPRSLKGKPMLEEIRGTGDGKLVAMGGLEDGFMVSSGFASSLIILHPVSQPNVDFRYLGRQEVAGRGTYVVAFAQRPDAATAMGVFRSTAGKASAPVFVQGVAWISADQFQVVRLRTDLLQPIVEAELNRQTSEIDYRPYRFLTSPKSFFLPSRVTVSIEWRNRRLRNEHIFSRFWLFNVETDSEDDHQAARTVKPSAAPASN